MPNIERPNQISLNGSFFESNQHSCLNCHTQSCPLHQFRAPQYSSGSLIDLDPLSPQAQKEQDLIIFNCLATLCHIRILIERNGIGTQTCTIR